MYLYWDNITCCREQTKTRTTKIDIDIYIRCYELSKARQNYRDAGKYRPINCFRLVVENPLHIYNVRLSPTGISHMFRLSYDLSALMENRFKCYQPETITGKQVGLLVVGCLAKYFALLCVTVVYILRQLYVHSI